MDRGAAYAGGGDKLDIPKMMGRGSTINDKSGGPELDILGLNPRSILHIFLCLSFLMCNNRNNSSDLAGWL